LRPVLLAFVERNGTEIVISLKWLSHVCGPSVPPAACVARMTSLTAAAGSFVIVSQRLTVEGVGQLPAPGTAYDPALR